ncbi:hypothetical protein FOZ62_012479 [Perkinsus olseni]|uniref:Uncharacterized protein n=1 Tax=Perkinsus olseni TaxID=32597 RepID=A0A7J6RZ76_PEROL|nr:hypothetical protein FOZ62_012479 [Perkinsus olseni]
MSTAVVSGYRLYRLLRRVLITPDKGGMDFLPGLSLRKWATMVEGMVIHLHLQKMKEGTNLPTAKGILMAMVIMNVEQTVITMIGVGSQRREEIMVAPGVVAGIVVVLQDQVPQVIEPPPTAVVMEDTSLAAHVIARPSV